MAQNAGRDYDETALRLAGREDRDSSFVEMASFFRDRLGRDLSEEKVLALFEIQQRLREHENQLAGRLLARQINDLQFFEATNTLVKFSLDQSREILGEQDFFAIYGEAGSSPEALYEQDVLHPL